MQCITCHWMPNRFDSAYNYVDSKSISYNSILPNLHPQQMVVTKSIKVTYFPIMFILCGINSSFYLWVLVFFAQIQWVCYIGTNISFIPQICIHQPQVSKRYPIYFLLTVKVRNHYHIYTTKSTNNKNRSNTVKTKNIKHLNEIVYKDAFCAYLSSAPRNQSLNLQGTNVPQFFLWSSTVFPFSRTRFTLSLLNKLERPLIPKSRTPRREKAKFCDQLSSRHQPSMSWWCSMPKQI